MEMVSGFTSVYGFFFQLLAIYKFYIFKNFVGIKAGTFLILLFSLSSAATMLEMATVGLGAVTAIVIVLLALLHMLAESINAQQLNAWVKSELRELVVAAILFVIVFGLFHADKPLAELLTGDANYKQTALNTINDMLGRAKNAYEDLIYGYFAVGMRSGFSTNLMAGYYVWASTGGVPYSGYSSFMTFFNQAATGLTNMIFLYKGLGALLNYFTSLGDKLLYLAFIFRVIPFTRQVGNTLVALAVGTYIIFPFAVYLVSVSHSIISVPKPDLPDSALEALEFSLPVGSTFICGEWYVRFLVAFFGEIGFALPPCIIVAIATWGTGFQPCWEVMTKVVYPIIMQIIIPIVWGLMLGIATFITPDIGEDFDNFLPFLRDINNLVVVSYIDIIMVALVTIVGIKSVSIALGGEYMLPGIQRLI